MKKIILTSSIVAVLFVACKSKKETVSTAPALNCANKALAYNTDIKSIIESSCTRCHNTNEKAGYNFFTIESVKKAALNGELLGTIKHQAGFPKMPKMADKLDQASIDKIECWINNGMKE
jgi:cytochrome c553